MKQSLYNISFENYEGEYIILNTMTGHYIRVSPSKKGKFLRMINDHSNTKRKNDFYAWLYRNGFLVDDDFDEKTVAQERYNKFFDNTKYYHLTIMPTEQCNFRCPYCFESFKKGKMNFQTCNDILLLVDKLTNKYQSLVVNWYGGEPLLQIETIEYLSRNIKDICQKKGRPFIASITTNGYLLSWDIYSRLKKCYVTDYTITIDGLAEIHNQTRKLSNGMGTFDTIINNILEIKKREKTNLINFTIRTNYTETSIKHRHEWENYLNQALLIDKRFKYLPRYAWSNQNSKLDPSQFIKFEFDDNISVLDYVDVEVNFQKHMQYLSLFKDPQHEAKVLQDFIALSNGSAICPAGQRNALTIGSDGICYKCQVALEEEINNVGNVSTFNGNIKYWEKSLKQIDDACLSCKVFPFCLGIGCRAKTLSRDDLIKRDIWCQQFTDNILKRLHILTYYSTQLEETYL